MRRIVSEIRMRGRVKEEERDEEKGQEVGLEGKEE